MPGAAAPCCADRHQTNPDTDRTKMNKIIGQWDRSVNRHFSQKAPRRGALRAPPKRLPRLKATLGLQAGMRTFQSSSLELLLVTQAWGMSGMSATSRCVRQAAQRRRHPVLRPNSPLKHPGAHAGTNFAFRAEGFRHRVMLKMQPFAFCLTHATHLKTTFRPCRDAQGRQLRNLNQNILQKPIADQEGFSLLPKQARKKMATLFNQGASRRRAAGLQAVPSSWDPTPGKGNLSGESQACQGLVGQEFWGTAIDPESVNLREILAPCDSTTCRTKKCARQSPLSI